MSRVRDELPPATAVEAMSGLMVDQLRGLVTAATGSRAQGRKAELVAALAGQLANGGVWRIYESLGEIDRAAVAEATHNHAFGRFDGSRFHAKYGRVPSWGVTSRHGPDSRTPLDLLFCGGRTLPADVRAQLLTFVPAPEQSQVAAGDGPPAGTVVETELGAQRELLAVLRLVETGKVAISERTRRPSAAALRLIDGVLEGGDFYAGDEAIGAVRAYAWPLIVQAAGLASLSGSRLALTKAGARALLEPAAGTITRAWRKWQTTTLIDELSRIDAIKGQSGRDRGDYHSLWGTDGLDFLSRYDGLTHIRLSPLGALCLGLADEYRPAPVEERRALRVLPNLEVTALDELSHADRLALDRYATADGERVWRLEREQLLAAVEAGETIDRIREFLEARSATELPATVTRLLDDVDERSEALAERGPALLIECSDRMVAALLANDRRTKGLCMLAGEQMLAVPAASEPAFRRAARQLGYVIAGQRSSALRS